MSSCAPCNSFLNQLEQSGLKIPVIALACTNLVYFVIYIFGYNLLSFVFSKLLIYLVVNIVKVSILDVKSKQCECYNEENIKRYYYTGHHEINRFLDKVRSIVLLHDISLLVKTLLGLVFTGIIGTSFSSLATLIIVADLFAINYFTDKVESISTIKTLGGNIIKNALAKVPKYVEKAKKD